MKKKFAMAAGIVMVLALGAWMLGPELAWDGAVNVQFQFHLVDAYRGSGVSGAKIRVIRSDQAHYASDTNFVDAFPNAITDKSGRSTVAVMCGAGGSKTLFGKSGRFGVSLQLLLVEASGYRSISTPLANVVGGRDWPLSKRQFVVDLCMLPDD